MRAASKGALHGAALVIAGAALAACAQGGGSGGGASRNSQDHTMQNMQGMSMEQMMAHCEEMKDMDRSQMTADMQQMMQQCDAMMRTHGSGSGSSM